MAAYVLRDGKLVEKHLARPLTPRGPRSDLPAPRIISDCCEFQSMADGQVYTSKAAYRRSLRDHGLVEVGNETNWATPRDPLESLPPVEQSVQQAWQMVEGV